MTPLLSLRGLSAGYGLVPVLHDIELTVGAGEAVALIGANGAGKTTLIRSIMGLVRATGEIALSGQSIASTSPEGRARLGIGYSPEGRRIFAGLTVRENLEVAARGPAALRRQRIDHAFSIFPQLAEKEKALGWQLSGGQQQMLAVARALMPSPRLLLLDEPSLGLSPLLVGEVISRVREIVREGTSVLLAEQNVAKALDVSNRAYVIKLGRIVASGPSSDMRSSPGVQQAFLGA
jgi:branched-chain amino acid transport system ATP-binding protein